MTIAEGICDYCGEGEGWLLCTGDERSQIQFGKLWCGVCREGSRQRYVKWPNRGLSGQIEVFEEMLEQHPLRWEPPYDHPRMHIFKLKCQDEIWRMKQELEYRGQDELPSKA